MCLVWTALKFWMELDSNEEIAAVIFNCLHQVILRTDAGNCHAVFLKFFFIIIVEFIPMTVALRDLIGPIELFHPCACRDRAWIRTQAHCAALIDFITLAMDEVNDFVCAVWIELIGVGIRIS